MHASYVGVAQIYIGRRIRSDGPDSISFKRSFLPLTDEARPPGVDTRGRDVLSRVIYGAQVSILTGMMPVAIGAIIAIPLGLLSGYYRLFGAVLCG